MIKVLIGAVLAVALTGISPKPAPHIAQAQTLDKGNTHISQTKTEEKPAEVAPAVEPAPVEETPPPAPVYSTDCEAYRPLIAQYGWNVDVAMNVMSAESGCNPYSSNWGDAHETCSGSFGLFQIACMSGIVYDPAENVAIAWAKYQANHWQPWGVCNRGIVSCY